MRARTLIGAGLAVALAAGSVAAYQLSTAVCARRPGLWLAGWHDGRRLRPVRAAMAAAGSGGPGQDNGIARPSGKTTGSGPAERQGQGYGPGYHMRGWGGGNGPGMMQGYGPAMSRLRPQGRRPGAINRLNLTTDDVKSRMERWLAWRGNPRLKVGEVKEKDADTITADIVTKDNSLVERFIVDRHTGFTAATTAERRSRLSTAAGPRG